MDVAALLERMHSRTDYAGQLVHVEELPERAGKFDEPQAPLPESLRRLLASKGIEQLYSHQVAALEGARAGRDFVVVTGTASGKTLCYNLPILEETLADSQARALYLFPTKALAQDQLKGLLELVGDDPQFAAAIRPGVYDGDTPTAQRRRIRSEANLVLSNPDMLHATVLPYHPKWAAFFSELFGTAVRYTGASIGYQLAAPLAGGLAPIICVSLLRWAGGQNWPVALYLITLCLITLLSVWLAAETHRTHLADHDQPS